MPDGSNVLSDCAASTNDFSDGNCVAIPLADNDNERTRNTLWSFASGSVVGDGGKRNGSPTECMLWISVECVCFSLSTQ